MEYEINLIIKSAFTDLKRHPHNRKTILQNYDRLFKILKNKGYTDFVAHQWTVSTLSKLHGSVIVSNAVQIGF